MKTSTKMFLVGVFLLLVAGMTVKTGIARWAFYELFALVKEVEVLGPSIVRLPPRNSPYQTWLERVERLDNDTHSRYIISLRHRPTGTTSTLIPAPLRRATWQSTYRTWLQSLVYDSMTNWKQTWSR